MMLAPLHPTSLSPPPTHTPPHPMASTAAREPKAPRSHADPRQEPKRVSAKDQARGATCDCDQRQQTTTSASSAPKRNTLPCTCPLPHPISSPHHVPQTTTSRKANHLKGCRCSKSKCLQRYCECFQAGVPCTSACKCRNCHNKPTSDAFQLQQQQRETADSGASQTDSDSAVATRAEHCLSTFELTRIGDICQALLTAAQVSPTAQRERGRGGGERRETERNERERQTDRQTDRQRGREADRQRGREADRQTDRQTDRQRGRVFVKVSVFWGLVCHCEGRQACCQQHQRQCADALPLNPLLLCVLRVAAPRIQRRRKSPWRRCVRCLTETSTPSLTWPHPSRKFTQTSPLSLQTSHV